MERVELEEGERGRKRKRRRQKERDREERRNIERSGKRWGEMEKEGRGGREKER